MLKLLIVDDERIIREGLSHALEWEKYGYTLCGSAENGEEALDIIRKEKPDLVLCDVKMPGMDGIGLISCVRSEMPDVHFVILSGYSEFGFAKKAMQFGVHDYLLKPCDESEIIQVLKKVRQGIERQQEEENRLRQITDHLRKVLPQVREQFLRDMVAGVSYSGEELQYYLQLFGITERFVRLVVLRIGQGCGLNEKIVLHNMAQEVLTDGRLCLSTILPDEVLLVTPAMELSELSELMVQAKGKFTEYYDTRFSIGISNSETVENLRKMYVDVQECLKCEFYLGEGSIITGKQFEFSPGEDMADLDGLIAEIAMCVRSGNLKDMDTLIDRFFHVIETSRLEITIAKTYCTELFLNIIRQAAPDRISEYAKEVAKISGFDMLAQITEHVHTVASQIADANYHYNIGRYSVIIRTIMQCVADNIANPELSLSWIARDVLYMNENYLGKLFFKETGEKFSQYVTNIRMQKAKELIRQKKDYKIYEISNMTGFADNTQYFSQVFKKAFGKTPSEFKKSESENVETTGF